MRNLKYLDDEVRFFAFLEVLMLDLLPNLEGLVNVEREEVFPCPSILKIALFTKLELSCLPSLIDLDVSGCNNELLRSISTSCGLTKLTLDGDLKVLSNEPLDLALEDLYTCNELESLLEKMWKVMQSL
ncbi:hypothetical protein MTR_5g070120 [Medicago truncatula]|uniref:Uncharacterized protein n=1 Tax=Medicago truncatula TaxID=3880 RepID=G7K6D6_MEDTR|nr:hypothetical protein MTR_5g070120 [Medicago truncatula]